MGAAVVLVLAAVGYEQFIPIHHVERARLARLVVAQPPAGFKTKPTNSAQVAASSSPFAAVKAAAKRSPNSTGSYSAEWSATASSADFASILVSLLPSGSDAVAVQAQATKAYLASASFGSDSYSLGPRFTVPGLSGAAAAMYDSTASKSGARLASVVFRVDRVVVVGIVQQPDATKAQAAVTSLAQAEDKHLRSIGSGFSLVVTRWPPLASALYGAVAVAIAVLFVAVPIAVGRARRRRQRAREEAARRAVRGRGRKIVRRQAARRR